MRDISGDTPLADSLIYASRMANEVQTYFTDPSRKYFTLSNSEAKFEINLGDSGGKGITYFGDYYGNKYFENSMDMYAIDTEGAEWSDRYSTTDGRQNTFRLGYYYTEAHIFDLRLAHTSDNDISFDYKRTVEIPDGKYSEHNATGKYEDGKLIYTVQNSDDPYLGFKLNEKV